MEQPRTPQQRQQANQADGAATPSEPPVRPVTLIFDTSLSADELRRILERALARDERFNQLVEEFKEIEAAPVSAAEKLADAMCSVVKSVEGDPVVAEAGLARRLLWPSMVKLIDDLVREHSTRRDDLRAKFADFTLPTNTGRGYLIAAFDVLLRGGMRQSEVEAWLRKRGIEKPKRVFEWRRQTAKRIRRRSDNALLDVVAATFKALCPAPRRTVPRAEAERLAGEWVDHARMLDQVFQPAEPEA